MSPETRLVEQIAEMAAMGQAFARAEQIVGLVPTMGALHEGHLSLIRRARDECETVVVSIFVNPTQFGEDEDLAQYPRDLEGDRTLCAAEKADLIFAPQASEMYADGHCTAVEVGALSQLLCGLSRPGHFRGVTTVVAKLLHLVQPDRVYFGQKDAQQLQVIRRMVRDLNFPVEVVACPIVREPDGLAVSSRNQFLNLSERADATCLREALCHAEDLYESGERNALRIIEEMAETIIAVPGTQLDYAAVVDPDTLEDVTEIDRPVRVALAVWLGNTRLIDNILLPEGVL